MQPRPQGFSHFLREKPWGRGCKLWRHCGTEWSVRETRISEMRGLIPRFDHQLDLIFS